MGILNNIRGVIVSAIIAGFAFTLNAQYAPQDNFDKGWKFLKGDPKDAEKATFDDSQWRKLDLPHDWAIEGPFSDKNDCRTGALPQFGTAWYRKDFTLPSDAKGKIVRLEFEGAMDHSKVWVNGNYVGERPYGYVGFEYDITKFLKFDGSKNVVAVRLDPKDLSSRWYAGAGIYRSVWLNIDNPVYVSQWGTFITTPTVNPNDSTIQNETTVINKTDENKKIEVIQEYLSPDGDKVGENKEKVEIPANSSAVASSFTHLKNVKLWDTENPNLYTCVTTLKDGGKKLDTYKTKFGIRSIAYDTNGFYLNGKKVRFNGVCLHHDNGALGSAVYRRADERKLQIMKNMGCNAIRTSHNPYSRTFLELCDEMGFLVIDEFFDCWQLPKVENGYNKSFDEWSERDLTSTILRDRNHPSVVMWSLGNEILEQHKDKGWLVAKRLNRLTKNLDLTRPTTCGFNYYPAPYIKNMAQQVDIAGMNYKPLKYEAMRNEYPQMPIYGSENSSCTSSRGVYHFPFEKYQKHKSLQVTSYDIIGPSWACPPDFEFYFQTKNPYVMGQFVWTGFDYLGEPTPYGGRDNETDGHWNLDFPSRSSYFGIVDLAGFPKDRYYMYQSEWTDSPMIHLLPHWNWEGMEGKKIPVYCYTNCDEAELFLNGKSLGKKVKGKDLTRIPVRTNHYDLDYFDSPYRLSWEVPYEKGELKVVGYKDGKKINEAVIKTAGEPAKIVLSADRNEIDADGRDLSYITVRIEDKNGNLCPNADNRVAFEVTGAGSLVGVDNGDSTSLESFQAKDRKAFSGMALAILRSKEKTGEITLKATSKGLESAEIKVKSK